MEEFIGLVAVGGSVFSIAFIAYLVINSRYKVRMALIQHGQDASIFREKQTGATGLKYGLLMIGVGLGILVGTVVETILQTDSPVPHFSMMLILGGAGLIIYYLVSKKRETDEIVR